MEMEMGNMVDAGAGKEAADLLRGLARGAQKGEWGTQRRCNKGLGRGASERLGEAVLSLDEVAASAAWEEGGRLELCDHLGAPSDSTRLWGLGARMWASGWVERGGEDPGGALAMARWLDGHGCLFIQRNRKIEAAARQAEAGGAQWRSMRVEAARHWPKMFEPIEARAPGVAAVLSALARGWAESGLMGSGGADALSGAIVEGCSGWLADPGALSSGMDWLTGALGRSGLGGSMEDGAWINLARHAESDGLARRARALLEGAARAPSQRGLLRIAAIAAVRGDTLLLAAAAERVGDWRWMVDAEEAREEAARGGAGATARGGAASGGAVVSALHAAAMGTKGRGPWTHAALMALLSIPEARARAAAEPFPRALVQWGAADLEWAAGEAPELLAVDGKGRCVAHEWAAAFGPSAVKRVAALAKSCNGWMMGKADAQGVTPMAMVEERQTARALRALYAGWEGEAINRDAPGAVAEGAVGAPDKAGAPRL